MPCKVIVGEEISMCSRGSRAIASSLLIPFHSKNPNNKQCPRQLDQSPTNLHVWTSKSTTNANFHFSLWSKANYADTWRKAWQMCRIAPLLTVWTFRTDTTLPWQIRNNCIEQMESCILGHNLYSQTCSEPCSSAHHNLQVLATCYNIASLFLSSQHNLFL